MANKKTLFLESPFGEVIWDIVLEVNPGGSAQSSTKVLGMLQSLTILSRK